MLKEKNKPKGTQTDEEGAVLFSQSKTFWCAHTLE